MSIVLLVFSWLFAGLAWGINIVSWANAPTAVWESITALSCASVAVVLSVINLIGQKRGWWNDIL